MYIGRYLFEEAGERDDDGAEGGQRGGQVVGRGGAALQRALARQRAPHLPRAPPQRLQAAGRRLAVCARTHPPVTSTINLAY